MKEIKLTQGQVALVDDDMFEELNQFKWYAARNWKTYYAVRCCMRKTIRMHMVILPPIVGFKTDHADRNGLNNQRSNLRYATHGQNRANSKREKQANDYIGITENKGRKNKKHIITKKWRAQIEKDGKHYGLGYYVTPIEAALAYDQKARELFGEFANTNF